MKIKVSALLMAIAALIISWPAHSAESYIDVTVGGHSICAIDSDNQLECTTSFERNRYLPVADGTRYTEVDSGNAHSCAITVDGDIRCWGLNTFGQLDSPTEGAPFSSLSAGSNHSCAVDANTQIQCWGLNRNKQLTVPVDENSGFTRAFAGPTGSCGIRDSGASLCWSTDFRYQQSDTSARYTAIAAGGDGNGQPSCGLTPDGNIDCWFRSPFVQLSVPDNGPYTAIDGNGGMLCGLTGTGRLDCAAIEFSSENLNNDIRRDVAEFESLPPLVKFDLGNASARNSTLCGIGLDGQLICAGSNPPAASVPGQHPTEIVPMNLSVAYYSDSTVELFWDTDLSSRRGIPFSGFNIYRDGQLIEFTSNIRSYVDDSLQLGVNYTYAIAAIDDLGDEGGRSAILTVNTRDRNSSSTDNNQPPEHAGQLRGLEVIRYSSSALELFWERPEIPGTLTYQVYRNGSFLANVAGPSYYDDDATNIENLHYSVVVLSTSNALLGVGFITATAEFLFQCN